MDVDSDSEMPTAGPSMGKVKHSTRERDNENVSLSELRSVKSQKSNMITI